jgi:hypothetical protein
MRTVAIDDRRVPDELQIHRVVDATFHVIVAKSMWSSTLVGVRR